MVDTASLFIPGPDHHGEKFRLSKRISAIQLVAAEDGGAKLGLLSQLGPGATVEICGKGFNERTVKVRSSHQYYFVFLEDLTSQAPDAASYLSATQISASPH